MCKRGFDSLNALASSTRTGLGIAEQISRAGFETLHQASNSHFDSLNEKLMSWFTEIENHSAAEYGSLKQISSSGFEVLAQALGTGFDSQNKSSKALLQNLESLSEVFRNAVKNLSEASDAGFVSLERASRSDFELLRRNFSEKLQLIEDAGNERIKLTMELEETKRKLEELKNPDDTISILTKSLDKEIDKREELQAQLVVARKHMETLSATRDAVHKTNEDLDVFRTLVIQRFDSVSCEVENSFHDLKSETVNRLDVVQTAVCRWTSEEILESKKGVELFKQIVDHRFDSLSSTMSALLLDLKKRAINLGRALDLVDVKEEPRSRRLSVIQEPDVNDETIDKSTTVAAVEKERNDCEIMEIRAADVAHERLCQGHRLNIDQAVHSLRHNNSRASVDNDIRIIRSGLLDRISNQLGHLYLEATTPDYEKVKPVQEEGTNEIICTENRFKSEQSLSWINALFGLGPVDAYSGKEQSRLIHPYSKFSSGDPRWHTELFAFIKNKSNQ